MGIFSSPNDTAKSPEITKAEPTGTAEYDVGNAYGSSRTQDDMDMAKMGKRQQTKVSKYLVPTEVK